MEAENNSSDHHSSRRGSELQKPSGGQEKALEDRISSLPNSLILHILSFLPTKHAARTSVLSKNWQYLWTSIPILDFHDLRDIPHYKYSHKNLNRFVSFINRSLLLNQSPAIEKFRVHLNYNKAFSSDVDVWLRFVTRKNVKELDLDLTSSKVRSHNYSSTDEEEEEDDDDDDDNDDYNDDTRRYLLPMNMLGNNSSLVTLKLKNCDIDHGRLINWESLKVLSLSQIIIDDDFITDMLLGCPLLELLELLNCWNYEFIDIKSERLRKLVISELRAPEDDTPLLNALKISAPYLQSLDISGFMFECINLSSLVDAKLNFYLRVSSDPRNVNEILVELLVNLRHVKEITMGSWCLQVLSTLEEKALPCPLASWVCLRVDTSLGERELHGITRLLEHTPTIETLIINTTSIKMHMYLEPEFLKSYDFGGQNCWSSRKSSFVSALLNLKTVRIIGFGATKCEVELLFFLLKNASMLETMIIHARKRTYAGLKNTLEVAQSLLSFPKCSQNAVVLFA